MNKLELIFLISLGADFKDWWKLNNVNYPKLDIQNAQFMFQKILW